MQNIKLTIAYDGSAFHGWQFQPGDIATIQGTLEAALKKITQERIMIHGASRTDAGVHAFGQVAHFKTKSNLTAQEIQRAMNALMTPTVRVVKRWTWGRISIRAGWRRQKTYRSGFIVDACCHRLNTGARSIIRGNWMKRRWLGRRESLRACTTSRRSRLRRGRRRR